MAMQICGLGVLSACGRGTVALKNALLSGARAPAAARAVPPEALDDKALFKGMRRADRLSKFAVMAAVDAWNDSAAAGMDPSRVGIVLATALGPHVRTFEFLDGILDFGHAAASPTAFSHSVHNAAVSYIAGALQTHGPTLTVTDFHFAFHQALEIAQCWLDEGRCDGVLVGAAEELGEVMLHVCQRMIPAAQGVVPGEGAAFLLLSNQRESNYGTLSLETDVPAGAVVANHSALFGNMMTDSAFHCIAAALTLADAPRGDAISCLKIGRGGERKALVLRHQQAGEPAKRRT